MTYFFYLSVCFAWINYLTKNTNYLTEMRNMNKLKIIKMFMIILVEFLQREKKSVLSTTQNKIIIYIYIFLIHLTSKFLSFFIVFNAIIVYTNFNFVLYVILPLFCAIYNVNVDLIIHCVIFRKIHCYIFNIIFW